jgi:hypothetical protein
MKRYVYLFSFSALFLFSCGNDNPEVNTDSDTVVQHDVFRDGIDKLKRNGFLKNYSGAKLDSLVAVYRTDSLNGTNNLLVASGDIAEIRLDLNGRSPLEVYKAVTDTIGMIYPDLKASKVNVKFLPNDPGGKDTGWVQLEQTLGERVYTRKLYYFEAWPVDNYMYAAYNTFLADQNKDTRLYLAQFFNSSAVPVAGDDFFGDFDVNRLGLMRLTQQQADSLMAIPLLALEPEQEFNVYPSLKVDAELEKLWSTGMFSNEKWFDTIAADVRHNSIYEQQDIIDFFDSYFATLNFDTLNPFNPYQEFLYSLEDNSFGSFDPSGIADVQVGQSPVHAVRFTINSKVYEGDFEPRNGIESPYFLDFVNNALTEQGVKGAFYSVSTFDKVDIIAFIEDDQLDAITKAGFFISVEKGAASEFKIIYGDPPKAF